ncbi:MAG TPA: hypothetical protein VEV62_12260 [Parafilimonas sp.]|jgi:hypothetical protein|nr:hypothetical protein [Parafilimonas sp.]
MRKEKDDRRNFLKSILTAGGAIAAKSISKSDITKKEKIKMLTADGKLVAVDKTVIEKNAGSKKASAQEVFEWMDSKHKT